MADEVELMDKELLIKKLNKVATIEIVDVVLKCRKCEVIFVYGSLFHPPFGVEVVDGKKRNICRYRNEPVKHTEEPYLNWSVCLPIT